MSKRLVSATLLLFALLFAQGGSFLIAAFCPHVRTGIMLCDTPAREPAMDHEHMADMQMDHESGESSFNISAAAFDRPTETCNHCAVHSKTNSSVFSVRPVEAAKRGTNLAVVLTFKRPERTVIQAEERLNGRAHGPPGGTISRHILIDVFRI